MSDAERLEALKCALDANALALGEALFGMSKRRSKNEIRWGNKGSTSFYRRSGRHWSFKSFESDEGGSLIDAIRFAHGVGFQEACDWARKWLGDPNLATQSLPKPIVADVDREEDERARKAQQLWEESRPLLGTPAETYLRQRDITPAKWPRYIGYHPYLRAIVFAATTVHSDVPSVQVVHLTPDGTASVDEGENRIKRTHGPMAGTAVRFEGNTDGPLCLCEGPETALSVWYAAGFETWAMRSSIAGAPLNGVPLERIIIVCRDDDPKNAPAQKRLNKAIRRWRVEGRVVLEALPWPKTRRDKSDFNDALVQDGPEAVRERVMRALEPPSPHLRLPAAKARQAVAAAIRESIRELQEWRPSDGASGAHQAAPFLVIRCMTGLGKTEEALRVSMNALEAGCRVVYLAPTHALLEGVAERARHLLARAKSSVTIRIWEGIERHCSQPVMLQTARDALANPEETICQICPDRHSCGKSAQSKARPELWIAPSTLLFSELPEEMKGADLVIVDETFASHAFVGAADENAVVLSIDQIRTLQLVLDKRGNAKQNATGDHQADLAPFRRQLADALQSLPLGPVERDRLVAAGLTAEDCDKAHKIEWERKNIVPNLSKEHLTWDGLKGRLQVAAGNREINRFSCLWKSIGEALRLPEGAASGRMEITEVEDRGTKTMYRAVRMYGFKPITSGWRRLPTLHLDATGDMAVIQTVAPHAELRADIVATTPHVRVTQYFDRAFSKGALASSKRLADETWRWCVANAQKVGGEWLVVTHKAHEDHIRETFTIPPFMHLAHHGAIEGRDEWRGVRGVIVIGTMRPPPKAMERLAGIVRGRMGRRLVDSAWYPAEMKTLNAKDGTKVTVEAETHPDPIAEAFFQAASIGRVIQAIGRGRGVNRDAVEPLDVLVLGNMPLDVQPDCLEPWKRADLAAEVMAEVGMFTENPVDLAKVAPQMFGTPKAAKRALEKARRAPNPYIYPLYGLGAVLAVEYQPAGQGMRRRRAWIDPRFIPDPEAFLTENFGPLKYFDHPDRKQESEAAPEPAALPPDLHSPLGPQLAVSQAPQPPLYRDPAAYSEMVEILPALPCLPARATGRNHTSPNQRPFVILGAP